MGTEITGILSITYTVIFQSLKATFKVFNWSKFDMTFFTIYTDEVSLDHSILLTKALTVKRLELPINITILLSPIVCTTLASRKDRRKKILLNTNRTFRPHGLPQQNREQSAPPPPPPYLCYRTWHRGTDVLLSRYWYVTPFLPTLFSVLLRKPVRAKRPVCI